MLDAAGLGLRGAIEIARYDEAVPGAWRSAAILPHARTAIVVASGGRSLWDAFARAPEFGAATDPLDAYTRRITEAATAQLEPQVSRSERKFRAASRRRAKTIGPASEGHRRGGARALFAFERWGGVYADFVVLGRLAGLGAPSRLGLLLHPLYGPWTSLRAVVLTSGEWDPGPPLAFDPCPRCAAPCALAPSYAAARRACVIGPEHIYSEAALAHHARHASAGPSAR